MTTDDSTVICPITQDYFRDPVIAEDGHVYEREAITRWINENGTSPVTRQILDVNHLRPDEEMRRKANQQRILNAKNRQRSIATQQPRDGNRVHVFTDTRPQPQPPATNTCCCCCEQIVEYRLCDRFDHFCQAIFDC